MNHQKHDIFVGNLSFTTTEEQLFTAFSDIGRVLGVRMVNDAETGKSRGFAFVEFEDPQAALAAIRNMNDYELNGRRLRVNFSNASHLEALANKLGMDLSANANPATAQNKSGVTNHQKNAAKGAVGGANAIADALKALSKAEMYDIVAQFKEIADSDPDEARRILSGHPQLPEAMLFLMSKLDMIKTSLPNGNSGIIPTMMPPPVQVVAPAQMNAPHTIAQATTTTGMIPPPPPPPVAAVPRDPRTRDPRLRDPRMQPQPVAVPSAPPPPVISSYPAPPMALPHQPMPATVDPGLIQQVMSLTPQQIAQLPPDKQQNILQLRQQVTQQQQQQQQQQQSGQVR